ncbi:MAG: hypothetical protein AAF720_13680 [Pseudomonadota bacterium]
MTKRLIALLLLTVFVVSACGKRAPLRTPSSDRPPAEESIQGLAQ